MIRDPNPEAAPFPQTSVEPVADSFFLFLVGQAGCQIANSCWEVSFNGFNGAL
jgi:hypothetical protein